MTIRSVFLFRLRNLLSLALNLIGLSFFVGLIILLFLLIKSIIFLLLIIPFWIRVLLIIILSSYFDDASVSFIGSDPIDMLLSLLLSDNGGNVYHSFTWTFHSGTASWTFHSGAAI